MNHKEIIERGYATSEEFKEQNESRKLEKLFLRSSDGFTEGIWIYPLEPSDQRGKKFHFVFHNDPVMFMGSPRAVGGLVGVATSNGPCERAVAKSDDCIKLFEKAGNAAIDYFWNEVRKHESKSAKRNPSKGRVQRR